MSDQTIVYVAGPMSGLPYWNVPAFEEAADALRALGYGVVTPVELDGEAVRAACLADPTGRMATFAPGETWGEFLARDIKLIADGGIDGVVVLPGWESSRGARLETFVAAALCHLPVRAYNPKLRGISWGSRLTEHQLVKAWAGDMWEVATVSPLRTCQEVA